MSWKRAFVELGDWLGQADSYWRESPFVHASPTWLAEQPLLAQQCLQRTPEQLENFATQPYSELRWLLQAQSALAPLPRALTKALAEPSHSAPPQTRFASGIPGRKWAQIQSFSAHIPSSSRALVDWCSGKAHLGRYAARSQGRTLHAIERNPELCAQGQQLARAQELACYYQQADVLSDPTALAEGSDVVALHACGDLHRTLINHPQLAAVGSLSLAPCCYHLWLEDQYQPLSQLGLANDLQLNRNQVQLAVQDLVHAPNRERKAHQTMAAWRLGFDGLQRELRGRDEYLSTPSVPHRYLHEGFPSFVQRLAEAKGLSLPAEVAWPHWEAHGWKRFERARRLQVVRHAFKRPLELWLVLDLALRLEERGFTVQLFNFCPRRVSPRNFFLQALKGAS